MMSSALLAFCHLFMEVGEAGYFMPSNVVDSAFAAATRLPICIAPLDVPLLEPLSGTELVVSTGLELALFLLLPPLLE